MTTPTQTSRIYRVFWHSTINCPDLSGGPRFCTVDDAHAHIVAELPRLRTFIDQGRIYTCYPDTGEAVAHVLTVKRQNLIQPAPDPETSTELRQTVDQLFDDVATLPIFSGTCPRVADPGRFDPAPVSTDQQLSMF